MMHKDVMEFINVKTYLFSADFVVGSSQSIECCKRVRITSRCPLILTNTMLGCYGDALRAVILQKTTFFLVKGQLNYQLKN